MYLIEPRLYCVRVKIYINLFLKNKKQKKHRLLSYINRNWGISILLGKKGGRFWILRRTFLTAARRVPGTQVPRYLTKTAQGELFDGRQHPNAWYLVLSTEKWFWGSSPRSWRHILRYNPLAIGADRTCGACPTARPPTATFLWRKLCNRGTPT